MRALCAALLLFASGAAAQEDPSAGLLGGPNGPPPGKPNTDAAVLLTPSALNATDDASVVLEPAVSLPMEALPAPKVWRLRPLASQNAPLAPHPFFAASDDAKPRKAQSTPPPPR